MLAAQQSLTADEDVKQLHVEIALKVIAPAVQWAISESAAEAAAAYEGHPLKKRLDKRRMDLLDNDNADDCRLLPEHMPADLTGAARMDWILTFMRTDQAEYRSLAQHITSFILQPLLAAMHRVVEVGAQLWEQVPAVLQSLPMHNLNLIASAPLCNSFCSTAKELNQLLVPGADGPRWADHVFEISALPPIQPAICRESLLTWLLQLEAKDVSVSWPQDGELFFNHGD